MHEVSVMAGIVEAVLERLDDYNVERVEELYLVVGKLTNLGEEQLTFAYEVVTRDTPLEGSRLVIESEPIGILCGSCGYEGEVEHVVDEEFHGSIPVLACPRCQGKVEVTSGRSCCVRSMKVVEK